MKDPTRFKYGDLKLIITSFREPGEEITGKPVRLVATFDPGTEFAKSDFKYKKHPEIGAPLRKEYDTQMEQGSAVFSLPPAWHREARVFVERKNGIIGLRKCILENWTLSAV